MRVKLTIVTMLLSVFCASGLTQTTYTPAPENLKARRWFQDAKFGLFIHWGVYSLMGDAEWVMQNQDIPAAEYERLADFFNPTQFSAEEWVALAKAAGMQYITITTKHHDGFAMYDSKISEYDIVDGSPYGKDIFRMLEGECRKQGLKLFAYYSQLDWHHPDYFPRGWTGRRTERPESGDWDAYLAYQDVQIHELARNYDIAGFWFDGWWDHNTDAPEWLDFAKYRIPGAEWHLERTYKMIHDVNPALLIGNNHHVLPFAGEDFQMFEKDLPGENTIGFNTTEIGALPLETCETINGSWGFRLNDRRYKSTDDLIRMLVGAAGRNANFLLNVGPMPDGTIQSEFVQRLKEMGVWMAEYGETIYGTRGGPFAPAHWGVSTQKGNAIFLHILNREQDTIVLPKVDLVIQSIREFKNKNTIPYTIHDVGLLVQLPEIEEGQVDMVLEIQVKEGRGR